MARDDNSLAIIAWERGDIELALKRLDRSIAVYRKQDNSTMYPGVLFNKAMVLHEAGRDAAALPLLMQVERLRTAQVEPDNPLLGDTARMIGEVQAALNQPTAARKRLIAAVRLTRSGYAPSHPHTRRAELSLALFDLRREPADQQASALTQLEKLSALPERDHELRKVAWLAAAALASHRCGQPGAIDAADTLAAIEEKIRGALPEGGSVVREFERERSRCL